MTFLVRTGSHVRTNEVAERAGEKHFCELRPGGLSSAKLELVCMFRLGLARGYDDF